MDRSLSHEEQQQLLTMLERELIPPVMEISKEHKAISKSRPITAPGYRMNLGQPHICMHCSWYSPTDAETGSCLKYDHVCRGLATCNWWRKKRV